MRLGIFIKNSIGSDFFPCLFRTLPENLEDLPEGCDKCGKKNSKGDMVSEMLGHVPIIDPKNGAGRKRNWNPLRRFAIMSAPEWNVPTRK